jgi:tetratricopeptide (TPR) repeat protein
VTWLLIAAQAALAAPAADHPQSEPLFVRCAQDAATAPDKALATALAWRLKGGGVAARQCEGLALAAQGRWIAAATAFENAAKLAERNQDGRATLLWVQAGNAALAGNDHAGARRMLGTAIAHGELSGDALGEAYLDRGRAAGAAGDMAAARADLDLAIKNVPTDPLAWLLSATLARRMSNIDRAEKDISEALQRAPDDSAVALEAGNIALLAGRPEAARTAFEAAVRLQPLSPSAEFAQAALKQLNGPAPPPR